MRRESVSTSFAMSLLLKFDFRTGAGSNLWGETCGRLYSKWLCGTFRKDSAGGRVPAVRRIEGAFAQVCLPLRARLVEIGRFPLAFAGGRLAAGDERGGNLR